MGQQNSRPEKPASASASRQEEEDEDSRAAGGGGGGRGTRPLLRHPSPSNQSQQVTNDPHKAESMKPEAQARAQSGQSDARRAHGPQSEPVAAVARGAVAAGRSTEQVLRAFGFELEHEVGKGSYASVYAVRRAHELPLREPSLDGMGERGSVKVIEPHKAHEDYVLKFLPNELDIMPRLRHPHILRTFLIWQERPSVDPRERIFMFVELADAGDLLQFIKVYTHI